MAPLDRIDHWPVANVAAAHVGPDGAVHTHGDIDRRFELASVTKLLTALAALVAHEEGTLPLDQALDADGVAAADLLAHSSGTAPEGRESMSPPHRRRIYSTAAYERLADEIARRAGFAFIEYLHDAVIGPLELANTELHGSPGAGARGSARDMLALALAWRTPGVVAAPTLERATAAHLPDLAGVLPGFGRHGPNPWGLGPEIRGHKHPHWTGIHNSAATFGHFGQAGTMMWIDPVADHVLVALADEPFGPWAVEAWPALSDAVLTG